MHLALDQSPRRIGWALGKPGSLPATGTHPLPFGEETHALFLVEAQHWLRQMIERHEVKCVCCESVFFGDNALQYARGAKLIGAIEIVCYDHDVRCFEIDPDTWRKRFIGFCKAPRAIKSQHRRRQHLKDAAMTACAHRDWPVANADEAEACGILDYMLACDFPDYGTTAGAPLFEEGAV